MEPVAGVSSESVATFRAISTRDAAAVQRDGEPVFAIRGLDSDTVEVLFGDGLWMLAGPEDVEGRRLTTGTQ
jgi:hypothetical protein